MKKIKIIFWLYIIIYVLWFLNHHFVKLGITQLVSEQFILLRIRDTLSYYSNELFFINFAALFTYFAKEIFWEVPLIVSGAYKWRFVTINKAAYLVSKSFSLPEEDVLHGLLVATYEGEFKGNLFSDQPQPTASEKKMTELACQAQSNTLSSEELDKVYKKLKEEHNKICKKFMQEPAEKLEDLVMFFTATPQWKCSSSKQIGAIVVPTTADGEPRPIASEVVSDKHLLGLLSLYEQQFRTFFPDPNTNKTFAELKKEYPVEFQHFLRISPNDYRLGDNWLDPVKDITPNPPQDSIFLQKFKKMKISGKTLKIWLRRFLNGEFDR